MHIGADKCLQYEKVLDGRILLEFKYSLSLSFSIKLIILRKTEIKAIGRKLVYWSKGLLALGIGTIRIYLQFGRITDRLY